MVVSPDVGGVVRARALARRLDDADLAIIDKRRPRANESEVMNIIGDVSGRTCVIVDDIVDTAGTLCHAASALKAHGANKGLVGRNLTGLKDPDGVKIVEKMIQVARDSGTGWVEYRWPNPVTKKLEQKASYVIRTGDVMVMVGAYKG